MNRFCASLLLAMVGMLMAVGGWALCCYVEGARALVGGVLLLVGGPLVVFAAMLGWWKAKDAENLFGAPISRDDYFTGVAIPYAEVPLNCPLKKVKSLAGEKAADGALTLRPAAGKGVLQLFPWSGRKGRQTEVEVRRRGDVTPGTEGAAANEAVVVVYRADSPDVTPALEEDWQWYGVMSGNAFPLLPDTLWYICKQASNQLKKRRACAVLFCDGKKLRVYPARRLSAVQELLKRLELE